MISKVRLWIYKTMIIVSAYLLAFRYKNELIHFSLIVTIPFMCYNYSGVILNIIAPDTYIYSSDYSPTQS